MATASSAAASVIGSIGHGACVVCGGCCGCGFVAGLGERELGFERSVVMAGLVGLVGGNEVVASGGCRFWRGLGGWRVGIWSGEGAYLAKCLFGRVWRIDKQWPRPQHQPIK